MNHFKQSLVSIIVMLFVVTIATTVEAAFVYWDEYAAFFTEDNLVHHTSCSYCYDGKGKHAAQSGSTTSSDSLGWWQTNQARNSVDAYMYIPDLSLGDWGTTEASIASSVGQTWRDINQNDNKGHFVYIGGFDDFTTWTDVLWTNRCSDLWTCTTWRTIWWDQVRVDE